MARAPARHAATHAEGRTTRGRVGLHGDSYSGAAPPPPPPAYASNYPPPHGYAAYPAQSYPPSAAASGTFGGASSASISQSYVGKAPGQGPPPHGQHAHGASAHHAVPMPPPAEVAGAPMDKPRYHDVWALVLFLLTLGAFVAVSAVALTKPQTENPFMPAALLRQWVYALLVVTVSTLVAGTLYTILMRVATRAMIIFSIILSVVLMIGYAIYFFVYISVVLGIIFLIIAVFYAFILFMWRHRIPFAVILVKTVMDTLLSYPSLLFVSFVSVILAVGVAVLFIFSAVYMFNVWEGASLIVVMIYYVFAFYWISQVRHVAQKTLMPALGSRWF